MNEPIISPWMIYLIGQADSLSIALFVLSVISATVAISFSIVMCADWRNSLSIILAPWVITFAFFMAAAITPDSKTLTAMFITSKVTPASLDVGIEAAQALKNELKQDIIELLDKSQDNANKPQE